MHIHVPQPLIKTLAGDFNRYYRARFPNQPIRLLNAMKVLFSCPGLVLLAAHRLASADLEAEVGKTARLRAALLAAPNFLFWRLGQVIAKSEITKDTRIGENVWISDKGTMIIGALAIGDGTVIHDHVTIGLVHGDRTRRPTIGANVWIGHDCVIFGDICIAEGVTLLPGTVLSKSVQTRNLVVQGNPPRVVGKNFDNSALRATCAPENASRLVALAEGKHKCWP